MAGETPGANRGSRRRKLNWNDDKSTNKIYASGDKSAISSQSQSDKRGRYGTAPAANPTPTYKGDEKSTDKYYRDGGVKGGAGAVKKKGVGALGPAPKLGSKPQQQSVFDQTSQLLVNEASEINGVLNAVVERLNNGSEALTVYIVQGDSNLLRRVRTAFDTLVTREIITEEQSRDVRFSYLPKQITDVEQKLAPIAPKNGETKRVEDEEDIGDVDPADFLAGTAGDIEDPVVDTSVQDVVEVDTSDDKIASDEDEEVFTGENPAPAVDTAAFLSTVETETVDPETSDATEVQNAEVSSEESVPPVEEKPVQTRSSRRSGRGTSR